MKTNTIYLFLISFITLALAVGFNVFVAKQISSKIETVKTHYAQSIQSKSIDFGSRLKKELATLLEQEEIIKNSFLNQEEIINFITDIESLAQKLNLEAVVEKVEKGEETTVGSSYKIQPVSFNLSVTGTFPQIEYFVVQLEKFQKISTVKEIKMYQTEIENQDVYTVRIILTSTILSI